MEWRGNFSTFVAVACSRTKPRPRHPTTPTPLPRPDTSTSAHKKSPVFAVHRALGSRLSVHLGWTVTHSLRLMLSEEQFRILHRIPTNLWKKAWIGRGVWAWSDRFKPHGSFSAFVAVASSKSRPRPRHSITQSPQHLFRLPSPSVPFIRQRFPLYFSTR